MIDHFWQCRQITLGRALVSLSILFLALAVVLSLVLLYGMRDHKAAGPARDEARRTARLVAGSLYSEMRTGANTAEIEHAIQRMNKAMPELKINFYPSETMGHRSGALPVESPVLAADPALAKALRDGNEALLVSDDGKSVRYLYPVQASGECPACDTRPLLEKVIAVIDVTSPAEEQKVTLADVIIFIAASILAILAIVFAAIFIRLRPLASMTVSLAGFVRKILLEMNLSDRANPLRSISALPALPDHLDRLLSTEQEYNKRLQELSVRDPLTNLYNRHKFNEFMQHEINRATRHQRGFSVIMIDLDNFKYVNDTFGHPIGDMVLKEFSVMLADELRTGDVLARIGGDEFAIILPETDAASGFQVANKLHQILAEKEFELPAGKMRCTASFSLVGFPEDGNTSEQIYAAMDAVLFKAKTYGKNQVLTSETQADQSMTTIFKQGDFLRKAMREGRIEASLQPIVEVQTGTVAAFEVLVRIRDGELVIPAGEFIEIAEELGMAKELDREVFRRGMAHYAQVSAKYPQATFFFNLFPRSFNDLGWVRGIPDMVRNAGVPCEKIVLEITEREALPNLTQVRAVIEELRASKIAVALDDFGSGFSSFLYMKYLDIDYVKIEGSFVRHMVADERDRIIVEQINTMAHRFGLKTVAEFVEDEATAKMLAEIGVDFAQGYYFGQPALPD